MAVQAVFSELCLLVFHASGSSFCFVPPDFYDQENLTAFKLA